MRFPACGKEVSGAEEVTVMQPVPALFGSVKFPVNFAPASRTIVSPRLAALSAI